MAVTDPREWEIGGWTPNQNMQLRIAYCHLANRKEELHGLATAIPPFAKLINFGVSNCTLFLMVEFGGSQPKGSVRCINLCKMSVLIHELLLCLLLFVYTSILEGLAYHIFDLLWALQLLSARVVLFVVISAEWTEWMAEIMFSSDVSLSVYTVDQSIWPISALIANVSKTVKAMDFRFDMHVYWTYYPLNFLKSGHHHDYMAAQGFGHQVLIATKHLKIWTLDFMHMFPGTIWTWRH